MSERFAVVRSLGRGGQGRVELVRDLERGELLARKRLIRADGWAARTLKHELRLLGGLAHPNLVQLLELGEDEGGPFLLMEPVEGRDIVRFCPGPGAELAGVLPQLLSVLGFLHRRGLAHGDLSPANVLVRRDGWVKLLDFGLAGALDTAQGPGGGTLPYLAPERRAGGRPHPAADRYGLGAILAHVVTRRPPVDGPPEDLPPGPVGAAIRGLMRAAPEDRTRLEALEAELLPALGAAPAEARERRGATLDRPELTARVHGTVLGRPGALVVLRGPSGVGKTTLAEHAAEGARAAGLAVSWARARPEERVAFNLMDALVDDLVDEVQGMELPARARDAAARAASTFPSLARLVGGDPDAVRVRQSVRARLFGDAEAAGGSRRALFEDVAELLTAAARGGRRLLVLDDLHWADADSVAFIRALLDEGRPELTMLGTLGDAGDAPIASVLGSRGNVATIDVPPLPEEQAARFLVEHGLDADAARRVARACEGLPALVDLALREAATDDPLAEAVSALVRDGEQQEKDALAMLLVSGTALRVGARIPPSAADHLVRRGLVARTADTVDIRHDALRQPLAAALGPDWLRAAHERWLATSSPADAELTEMVRHLEGAGRSAEAAPIALAAAERAARADAHDLAADLYGTALRSDDRAELRERRAEELELALRYEEAAAAWAELHRGARDASRAKRYGLAEAHALLSGRRIAEGRERLDAVLRDEGEPGIGRGRLWRAATLLRFVAGPVVVAGRRARVDVEAAERLLRGATIVGYFDTVAGLRLLLDARDSFARGGRDEQAAWCELLLSFFARFGHPRGPALADRYRRAAARRLEGRPTTSPIVRAFPDFLDAYDALRDGHFRAAVSRFDAPLELVLGTPYERSFEVQLVTSLRTSAVLATQDVDAAEAAVARFAALAREGMEVAIQCHVDNARTLLLTWRGRFEDAVETMDRLRERWPTDPPTVQSLLIASYAALPTLLLGEPLLARARLRRALEQTEHLGVMRTAYGLIVAAIAAACETAAWVRGAGELADARRWAELACRRPSVLGGLGHRVAAALELHAGRRDEALARYRRAEREARRLGQRLDLALARFGRARLEQDLALQAQVRGELARIGASPRLVVEHERLTGSGST